MFRLHAKEIIVNDDTQVIALEDDGTAYADNDMAAGSNAGGLILDGFINDIVWSTATAAAASTMKSGKNAYFKLLAAATRIIKTSPSAGVTAKVAYTVTAAAGGKKGDTYRVVVDSLDLTPTEYQNRPTEKRYQLGVDCANAVAVIAELVSQINNDPNAQVTAYQGFNNVTPVQDDSAKIVLISKSPGVTVQLAVAEYAVWDQTTYTVALTAVAVGTTVYHTAEDTNTVTALGALPVGTYDALKNINWAKNFDIDRNINWMPLPGASYNTYFFTVVTQQLQTQGGNTPNVGEVHNSQEYDVRLFVKTGTTLATALDLAVGDVNV